MLGKVSQSLEYLRWDLKDEQEIDEDLSGKSGPNTGNTKAQKW